MTKLANGWHRLPGDGQKESPHCRAFNGVRGQVWVLIFNDEVVRLTWLHREYPVLDKKEMLEKFTWMALLEGYSGPATRSNLLDRLEKDWGATAKSLLKSQVKAEPVWASGKVLIGAIGLLFVASRAKKHTAKNKIEQPGIASPF